MKPLLLFFCLFFRGADLDFEFIARVTEMGRRGDICACIDFFPFQGLVF